MYEVIKDTLDYVLEDLECTHDSLLGCKDDIEGMPKKKLDDEAEDNLSNCYFAATRALQLSDKVMQLSYEVKNALLEKIFENNKFKSGD